MRILGLFALFLVSAAHAQTTAKLPETQHPLDSVAAVVNGDIITWRDVDARTKLALISSSLPDVPDLRGQVQNAQLRRLIDEDLKIQSATKERIPVSDDDIKTQLAAIEQQSRLPVGGLAKLLASKGIEMEAMRQQVRAEIAWARLVHLILTRKLHVSENAVTTRLDAIRANLGKPEYHAAEIFLSLDDSKNEAEVRDLAERLTSQMHQGAPFTAIARQFNQAGAADGDLGWVSEGMLDDELMTELSRLQPNAVTPPIRTTEGYHILTLLEKRKVGEGIASGSNTDVMIIDLNSLSSAGQAERDLQMQHLREALVPAKSCEDLTLLSKQVPSAQVNIVEKMPQAQIPAKVAAQIKDIAPGQITEPIDTPKGRRFFSVCGRGAASAENLPSADDIRHQMEDEQLELIARRYVFDLHARAVIDIRR